MKMIIIYGSGMKSDEYEFQAVQIIESVDSDNVHIDIEPTGVPGLAMNGEAMSLENVKRIELVFET